MLSAKKPALRRYIIIDRELRNGTYPTHARLAELTETTTRTIARDIQDLQLLFAAPIAFDRTKNGWHYTEPTYHLPALLITEGELLAIFLASHALPTIRRTAFAPELHRAIRKITELLPEEISIQWETLDQIHSFRQSAVALEDVDTFRQLTAALLKKRQLHIRYFSAYRNAESQRTIDPWHLTCIDGDWYLIAYCHTRNKPLTFAPARIKDIAETGQTFHVPNNFRPADFFDGSFKVITDPAAPPQTVRLRFEPDAAKYIREKIWHPSQHLTAHKDGSATVELSLTSFIEVKRWILSWGSQVEVLAPETLRAEIHAEALNILSRSKPQTQPRSKPGTTKRKHTA